jgi:hypothetical protein
MSGGEISGNTASSSYGGGGVYVDSSGTFTMQGGEISGNTASSGGGVYVYSSGTFTMSGGEISGNTASSSYGGGGGVCVYSSGSFTKQSGGVIYGSNETGTGSDGNDLKNTAGASGAAVYYYASTPKYRNTTVRLDQNLSTGSNANWSD